MLIFHPILVNEFQTGPDQTRPDQQFGGGASKGVLFALLKVRASQSVSIAIDINPAKQGKFNYIGIDHE